MPLVIGDEEKMLAMQDEFGALSQKFGDKETKWGKKQLKELVDWFSLQGGPYPEDTKYAKIPSQFEDPDLSLEQVCVRHYLAMYGHRYVMTRCGARGKQLEGPPLSFRMDTPSVLRA